MILAGGTGTRLWPLSRDIKPKQFHAFTGSKTMLQQTYERLSFLNPKDIFVATNAQYEKLVKQQLKGLPPKNLIIEPAMRDTGPCICYAAHSLEKLGFENEVMAIVYADHLIQKPDEFAQALLAMEKHVKRADCLAVIAVRAKYPNTSLGYIKIGSTIKREDSAENSAFEIFELDKFVEKPTFEKAKTFLNSYKYLWNTGLYMWKIKTILQKFRKLAPEIYKAIKENDYAAAPKISIDYAIMEKIEPEEMHAMPAELGWNDIGNWAALHEELAKNEKDNITSGGQHLAIDSEGCVIFGNPQKLTVTYGVKDMVIIDTDEALLIMPKEKAKEAKRITEELKRRSGANL